MKWLKRNIINDFLEAVSNNEKKDKSATINISLFSKEISVKFHVDNLVGILNGAKNNKVLALPSPQEDNSSLEEIATPNSVVSENDPETLGSNSQSAEVTA
ncbi:hypothetical protein A499_19903, partial [Niallia nealsonii AAU1]